MIGFLRPANRIQPLPIEKVAPEYTRLRLQVFAGIFVGYAASYLVRKNFSLAIPDIMVDHPEYSKETLGGVMTWLSLAYGASKFFMGTVSDRSNPRWFLFLGLILSALIQAYCGIDKSLYASLLPVILLQVLNGWVQGMCWPPCGQTLVHWFSTKERGRTVSFWNIAHNLGGGLAPQIALVGVAVFHDWGAKFYVNALVASFIAGMALLFMRDTPQSCGLPPIEEYKNDYPDGYSAESERSLSVREILFKYVLNNKYLWYIAIANAFVYFVRYGIADWIPTYLKEAKGFTFSKSAWASAAFEYAAIPGTLLCGWVSDRIFKSQRAPATMLFMGASMAGLLLYWFNKNGPLWIDIVALITIGFLIYGPIMLIGLHALDLVPKKAAGTAAGFTGFFGYVFGSAIAGKGVGYIADRYTWNGVFVVMTLSCLLAIIFSSLTLSNRKVLK